MTQKNSTSTYNDDSVTSLDWKEHIRKRPGMYIGKLGNGGSPDDGIYILIKEVIDNSIDEFNMGFGKTIDISFSDKTVTVRDYGRGIPQGKLFECVAKINTGAKYDSQAFQKSVGLNGVGLKAVNALSSSFKVTSTREGKTKWITFDQGNQLKEKITKSSEKDGTLIEFIPDATIFGDYAFDPTYIELMLWHYAWLNTGLILKFNGKEFTSKNGLLDLLTEELGGPSLYPIIHLKGEDIEIALTHTDQYGESFSSFVNGQNTTQGGTHLNAFKEAFAKTIREYAKEEFDGTDIRNGLCAAIAIRVQEPVFESQTKTKLGSQTMSPNGVAVRAFFHTFLAKELDNYLHKHTDIADILVKQIKQSAFNRKELEGVRKIARERAKQAKIHNHKLRDCKIHFDGKDVRREESTLFITEGDSASGSITKSRDVQTQAVFSLKGKPLNCYGLTKKIVYENEEFNLLQHALNIEESLDDLRYNQIVLATDADVDGMHIRLLLTSFFLQFFPDLVKHGHLYILQTPLFRVRNRKTTTYCYSETEKDRAVTKLGPNPEITRFKGLGEISPDEFRLFIGKSIRLESVLINKNAPISNLLEFYMGKNTPPRQDFIVQNLRNELI